MDNPSPLDRHLRITTLISFWFAFALLIPYGLASHTVVPALGLVPAFVSAVLNLIPSNIRLQWRGVVLCIDMAIAAFLFALLVPFWVRTANNMRWSTSGNVMLGTYGSVPLIIDLCIHVFFILGHISKSWRGFSFARTCPNCHTHIGAKILPSIGRVSAEKSRHSCDSDEENQPLASTRYDDGERVSSEADTLYRPSIDTLGSTETVMKLI